MRGSNEWGLGNCAVLQEGQRQQAEGAQGTEAVPRPGIHRAPSAPVPLGKHTLAVLPFLTSIGPLAVPWPRGRTFRRAMVGRWWAFGELEAWLGVGVGTGKRRLERATWVW
jgi:hypothetical protein